MVKDLIRVGPPQGSINDLDLGVPKEFDKDIRKDFEKELKMAKDKGQKSDTKESRNDVKAEKEKPSRDLDQVSKKSSGGIKKKMARAKDDDDSDAEKPEKDAKAEIKVQPQAIEEKISKVMVSDEGEVEIADSEENLPLVAPEQANIQNMQAQLLAAQLAATGTAMPASEQQQAAAAQMPIAAQGEAAQQQSFQYLTNTEQALLADINGEQALANPEMALANGEVSANAETTTELQLQNAATAEATSQMPEQDVQAKEEKQATALESKVFDILSKENAKPGLDQKLVQQEVSPKAEQTQALNQTNAVLAKSSAENDQRQGENKHQSSGGGESQSQSLPKFDASNDLAAQVQALHTGQRSFQSHLGAAAGASATAKPEAGTDAVKDENIREIMNQAKYLVTKGGGEMTVRMTPEGMGEVQLKVALENGKINIEMNSQDKSVKKLIEDSLSDLKSSLASHQMRVEHVKINNVTAVDTNNQSQFQSDANSSNSSFQNRQQQEMNFQNFANSNSGRGGYQQERGSSSYQTVQAPTVKPVAKANAYVAANKGSSINMVA